MLYFRFSKTKNQSYKVEGNNNKNRNIGYVKKLLQPRGNLGLRKCLSAFVCNATELYRVLVTSESVLSLVRTS